MMSFNSNICSATPGPSHCPRCPALAEKSAGPKKNRSIQSTLHMLATLGTALILSIKGMTSTFSFASLACSFKH